MKTKAEDIKTWLLQSVNTRYLDERYGLMQRAFAPGSGQIVNKSGQKMPDYPDLANNVREIGTTNWILQAQVITMSRILRAVPEPEFPDVDEFTGQVRQAFWKARSKPYGRHHNDGFTQIQKAWLDGDGLGLGFVQYGLKTDPKTGYRRVVSKHVPLLQMIWDRHARSFCDAQMACSMSYMPFHTAEAVFGPKKARENISELKDSDRAGDSPLEVVRVFEYFDLGRGKSEPTSAIILGDVTNDPEDVDENGLECLPFAHYEHILMPGHRRAEGRVDALVSDLEGLNQLERDMTAETKRPGFDLMSPDILNDEDIAKVEAGMHGTVVRSERALEPGDASFQRVPAGEVSQTNLAVYQMRKESFMANAGTSELERGQEVEGADTLGEVQLVDQRSKTQSNWTVFQTARFFQRNVDVFMKVAMKGDDEPVMLDVLGNNVQFNDPANPNLQIAAWLEEPSDVIVSEEELMKGDLESERQGKIARLNAMADLVQGGIVDPIAYAEEKIKALGYDPKKFMAMNNQEMMAPTMQEEQPGQAPAA